MVISGDKKQLEVALSVDPARLAALRVLCSQVGFAIDNYLAELRLIEEKQEAERGL